MTLVSPLGVKKGKYFQVYAPNQNENIYTNDWTGPFYGFRNVVQTFKLTDKPLRLKPIDIYYHFYSGTKKASLAALMYAYDWALSQQVFNIYVSDYFKIVLDFNRTTIAQTSQGWQINNKGNIRELRSPRKLGYPDLKNSKNIIGYDFHGKDLYVHLGPNTQSYLQYQAKPPTQPYLVNANGFVEKFSRNNQGFKLQLKSYMKLNLTLANMSDCKLTEDDKTITGKRQPSGNLSYNLKTKGSHAFTVTC